MKVLVTGAAGFVGYAVAALLIEQGHQVTGLTRSPTSPLPAGVQRLHGDLRKPETLPPALADIDGVCHLAGLTKVRESRTKPVDYWRTNVGGTLAILHRLADAGVGRVVLASTCTVYGQQPHNPSAKPQTSPRAARMPPASSPRTRPPQTSPRPPRSEPSACAPSTSPAPCPATPTATPPGSSPSSWPSNRAGRPN
jgi:nucleoside-diphosphate-sugar epimerase